MVFLFATALLVAGAVQRDEIEEKIARFRYESNCLSPEAMITMLKVFRAYECCPERAREIMELHRAAIRRDKDGKPQEVDLDKLNELAKSLVWLYTTPLIYKQLNEALRTNHPIARDFEPFTALAIHAFRSDLDVFRKFTGTVYRGLHDLTRHQFHSWFGKEIDAELTLDQFSSASRSKEEALKFVFSSSDEYYSLLLIIEIRAPYASKGVKYMPIDIQHESKFEYEQEVLLPVGVVLRVVQVSQAQIPNVLHLETTQFPSVWWFIEQFDANNFVRYAKEHGDIVGAPNARKSFPNAIAESFRKHVRKSQNDSPEVARVVGKAADMFSAISYSGANMNEKSSNGSVALETVCDAGSAIIEAYQERVVELVSKLTSLGASPAMVVGNKAIKDKYPSFMTNAATRLAPAKWQYYLDLKGSKLHDEPVGWHDFDRAASCRVEDGFVRWWSSSVSSLTTQSGYFTYDVDFSTSTQRNTDSGTVRTIRRSVLQ